MKGKGSTSSKRLNSVRPFHQRLRTCSLSRSFVSLLQTSAGNTSSSRLDVGTFRLNQYKFLCPLSTPSRLEAQITNLLVGDSKHRQSITKNIEEKEHSPIDLKFWVEYVLLKAHIELKAFSDTFLVYLNVLCSGVTHAKIVSTEQSNRREAYQTRLIWSLPCAYTLTRKFRCNVGKTSCHCG